MNGKFSLSFRNLNYQVKPRIFSKERKVKDILKGINGDFNVSELSAIIGLSGSGKSSLLDCLSGFRVKNVTGSIKINDKKVKIKECSSYIMQEYKMHELLTVNETMMLSMNLRNSELNAEEKATKIFKVLKKLNIDLKRDVFVVNLSGGELKRLSIAVELIHDPKIIFLDEPTTGLDIVASTNCIHHLKQLAIEGHAVIITIHQASAHILKIFDHIYALADGRCIYQGTSEKIVPFLSDNELECPLTHNPADYLLEIANCDDNEDMNEVLSENISNGLNENYRKDAHEFKSDGIEVRQKKYSTSYVRQVYYLMLRTFLITSRDKTLFYMRLLVHIITGIGTGLVFQDVGNKGEVLLFSFTFILFSMVLLFFTSFQAHVVSFPLELPIIKRENFNGWYSTRAYYTTFILFELPITFICCTTYVAITYWMTDQPRELFRFGLFLSFSLGMSFTAHILAIALTALMNAKFALTYGFFLVMPILVVSPISLIDHDKSPFKIFFDLNFFNNAVKGLITSILDFDRKKVPCSKIFCPYENPKTLLRELYIDLNVKNAFIVIFITFIILHVISFTLIRYRLKKKQ